WKAKKVLREFKPDVAIGVGGYASGPLLRCASSLGIPTVIQEQNSFPGVTNRLLAKKAKVICVAYDGLERYFPLEKIVKTGNPVRREVVDIDGKRAQACAHFQLNPDKSTVLIIGGSLGARTINEAVAEASLAWKEQGFQVIWQTGKGYYQQALKVAESNEFLHVHEFIREMDLAYCAADIVVSRAGAMSISELCLVAKPSIFVPSPNVSEDHQTKNAMALVHQQAAEWVVDSEALHALGGAVTALLQNPERLESLSKAIAKCALPSSDERIVDEVFKVIEHV
ncbi:MAG: UDP-N-acetylglucosamine--N-acetylmuramyl-(pentapeptide) pyrophosphoryl-undecaprenol N-acetylglucosamine transferase, partial [Flavobacteriales bacterium]